MSYKCSGHSSALAVFIYVSAVAVLWPLQRILDLFTHFSTGRHLETTVAWKGRMAPAQNDCDRDAGGGQAEDSYHGTFENLAF